MDWPHKKPLRPGMRTNPVLQSTHVDAAEYLNLPNPADLRVIFPTNRHSLKTWGRFSGEKHGRDPHWIGVCKSTPLHIDPAYPRYTHHLIMHVDPGFYLQGLDGERLPLSVGTVVVLDTHSPHQLKTPNKDSLWYLAVSIDNATPYEIHSVIPPLIKYGHDHGILTPDTEDMV